MQKFVSITQFFSLSYYLRSSKLICFMKKKGHKEKAIDWVEAGKWGGRNRNTTSPVILVLWGDAWTPEVCSQRSTANTSTARQQLARHVSAVTDRLVCQTVATKLTHVFASTKKHTITWTVGDGDLYSVRPEVIYLFVVSDTWYIGCIHSSINGTTALCWALASSSIL
jgi:hypothetical protein